MQQAHQKIAAEILTQIKVKLQNEDARLCNAADRSSELVQQNFNGQAIGIQKCIAFLDEEIKKLQ